MAIALSVAFTPTPLAASEKVVIEMTQQVSAGVSFVPRSGYKSVFIGAAATVSPADVLANYTALYGALISGMKIFARVRVINDVSGMASSPLLGSVVVT